MKNLRTWLLAAAVLLFAGIACADIEGGHGVGKDEGFGDLTVDQVADLIAKKDADIFDNNTKEMYEKGHVPTAKWVAFNPVKESDLPKDKSRKLVFYCKNTRWMSCHMAARGAVKYGYKNVYVMSAGIQGWEKAGKPVEKA